MTIEDDKWKIGIIAFIILFVAFNRWLNNIIDSLICSVFSCIVGYIIYKLAKYVWKS